MEEIKPFLIDSDVLIDFLRGRQEAKDFLVNACQERRLLISSINLMEVYSGKDVKDENKRKVIDDFLNSFEIVDFNQEIAKNAGLIRANGGLPFADAIVGASALGIGAILVTRNVKHFIGIENLETLNPY